MKHKLATAFNVGIIIAIFIVLLRQPNGVYMAGVFTLVLAACLAGWWVFARRGGNRSGGR